MTETARDQTGEAAPPALSIVIPFYDEERNVVPVIADVRRHQPHAEIIAVDDCSRDATYHVLQAQPEVRALRLPRHLGQSAALWAGLVRASGDVCVILDGDGQSSAADIKRLLEHLPAYDFVVGRRVDRRDATLRVLASRIANRVRNWVLHDGMSDTGGTPKVLKRECVEHLPAFDGMHRFIPALLGQAGYRGLEVAVEHRARLYGHTKYTSWGRGLRGLYDLVGVRWLLARRYPREDLPRD